MGNGTVRDDGRYWAFISYSHKDAAFGRRLHRRLEAYALPRRLVGRMAGEGLAVPRRLTPIFRDREEFPAAQDLSAEVRAALKESRCLIVVCSPAAAASPWVAREVELFRELHPGRPVFAAIREGDPKDSLPPVLRLIGSDGRAVEPLAADFRRGHDGWELGLLKLIAGLLGVGLDELVQRDGQRKTQRVMAVTATAVIAMLIMSVLTAIALSARSEAERQRGEAEGLVEFMLTDLRTKLKGVGRLDIMSAVNGRSLKYCADQDVNRLQPESLELCASVLHESGEDDEERGNYDAALKKFLDASRTTAALLAEDPTKSDRIFAQAQSEYWVALIQWRKNDFAAAQAGFQRYADLAARLLAIDSHNPDWQLEASYAESNLGTLALRNQGDPAAAHGHFARALRHKLDAARTRSDDVDIQRAIANTYGWLADSERLSGKHQAAVADRAHERAILTALAAADPRDTRNQSDMLGNDLGIARLDMEARNWTAAATRLDDTLKRAQALLLHDPENEKLAKQVRAVQLFRVENFLNSGETAPERLSDMQGTIGDCREVLSDAEIGSFCRLLKVKLLLRAGEHAEAQSLWKAMSADRARWNRLPYSPRWGIDFRRDFAVTNADF